MCLTSALPKILTEVETFGERCGGRRSVLGQNTVIPGGGAAQVLGSDQERAKVSRG